MWKLYGKVTVRIFQEFYYLNGEPHTVREFISKCTDILEINDWEKYVILSESIISRKIKGTLVDRSEAIKKGLKWNKSKNFEGMVEFELF